MGVCIENNVMKIDVVGSRDCLWRYQVKHSGEVFRILPPRFEVNGDDMVLTLTDVTQVAPAKPLANHTLEYRCSGVSASNPNLSLELTFRVSVDNPIVRFRYRLTGSESEKLTKRTGKDNFIYFGVSCSDYNQIKEIQLSEFVETIHSFHLTERPVSHSYFANELDVMGPIFVSSNGQHSFLSAYEHGSQVPDAFVHFTFGSDDAVRVQAVKGNYRAGQCLGPNRDYQTLWFEFGAIFGTEDQLASNYRSFVLNYMSLYNESRKPYVYYNTWNKQERGKKWRSESYLRCINQEDILAEVDAAHEMGIEIFVIDTGWFEKTGDWEVNRTRFPDKLKSVKDRLDAYGMKLGLWFGPVSAALSSRALHGHKDCIVSWNGRPSDPYDVWESESSHSLCLVSRYGDAFADELIRLAKEVGVTYFKWDGIGQYGCNDPNHWHGDHTISAQDRADCYAFELVNAMQRIVEKVCTACPEAIVDFDVTESARAVGLAFLSVGKYFLMNNGPYYVNFDLPNAIEPNGDYNLFFYPGPARTWICRTPLHYDKWIPSTLFLTHYLPDDGRDNQLINIGSLILGQNGIWGDLEDVSDEGRALFHSLLGYYKEVREDITESTIISTGTVGGNPEIYEKISDRTGRGVIVIFASSFGKPFAESVRGTYRYVTNHRVSNSYWHNEGVQLTFDAEGHAIIEVDFDRPSAKIIYFGVETQLDVQ